MGVGKGYTPQADLSLGQEGMGGRAVDLGQRGSVAEILVYGVHGGRPKAHVRYPRIYPLRSGKQPVAGEGVKAEHGQYFPHPVPGGHQKKGERQHSPNGHRLDQGLRHFRYRRVGGLVPGETDGGRTETGQVGLFAALELYVLYPPKGLAGGHEPLPVGGHPIPADTVEQTLDPEEDQPVHAGHCHAVAGMYGLIFFGVKGLLDRIGRDRVAANRERFMAAGEALGGIKDIKLLGREQAYLSRFRPSSIRFARHQATNQTISEVPKSLIEAVAIGGVLALALFLMATRDGVGEILPMLGLYAFAGYRLLPAAQRVYAGISNMRFGTAAVDSVYEDLRYRTSLAEIHRPAPHPLLPQREIRLRGVSFAYPHASAPALRNIDTAVPVGTSVGLAGRT